MAETPPKRVRDESHDESSSEFANSKRQKLHSTILNLLDEEEEHEPSLQLSQDLSAIFTTLQQELSFSTSCDDSGATFDFESLQSSAAVEVAEPSQPISGAAGCGGGDDVMRHLLEASDDELGIPNTRDGGENIVEGLNNGENFAFALNDNGLWELEDEPCCSRSSSCSHFGGVRNEK